MCPGTGECTRNRTDRNGIPAGRPSGGLLGTGRNRSCARQSPRCRSASHPWCGTPRTGASCLFWSPRTPSCTRPLRSLPMPLYRAGDCGWTRNDGSLLAAATVRRRTADSGDGLREMSRANEWTTSAETENRKKKKLQQLNTFLLFFEKTPDVRSREVFDDLLYTAVLYYYGHWILTIWLSSTPI